MATRDHGPRGDKATFFLHRGLSFTRHTERDDQADPPWEQGDGYGIVTDWINTSWLAEDSPERDDYHDPEKFRPLNHDGATTRFYDWAATLDKARAEGWGLSDQDRRNWEVKYGRALSAEEITRAAVDQDYRFIRGWCRDEWEYVGVVVTLEGGGKECTASVWGIESSGEGYIEDTARELADQIIEEAGDRLEAEINRLNQLRATVGAATRKGAN